MWFQRNQHEKRAGQIEPSSVFESQKTSDAQQNEWGNLPDREGNCNG